MIANRFKVSFKNSVVLYICVAVETFLWELSPHIELDSLGPVTAHNNHGSHHTNIITDILGLEELFLGYNIIVTHK